MWLDDLAWRLGLLLLAAFMGWGWLSSHRSYNDMYEVALASGYTVEACAVDLDARLDSAEAKVGPFVDLVRAGVRP